MVLRVANKQHAAGTHDQSERLVELRDGGRAIGKASHPGTRESGGRAIGCDLADPVIQGISNIYISTRIGG